MNTRADEARRLLTDAMLMLKEIEKARELPPFAQAQQQYVALGREIEAYLKQQPENESSRYVECGCCGHFHRPEYRGDCRNDAERFSADQLDAKHGENGWDYREETNA